ncbi:MAG: hypothetical protein PHE93_05865 [Clostridia bacterium]|nr:hypothetical protein [Clostridia bacterium]
MKNELASKPLSAQNRQTAFMTTRTIVLVGLLSAALTVGKLALSFVPNVEVVTLLILVYASVFGRKIAIFATMIFCTIEVLLYGFSSWVVLYFIHWNMLALIASIILKRYRVWLAIVYACVMTFFFGILDTAINTIFAAAGGVPSYQLLNLFVAYYIRGGWFYLVHIVSNAVVVGSLYFPLVLTIKKLYRNDENKRNLE